MPDSSSPTHPVATPWRAHSCSPLPLAVLLCTFLPPAALPQDPTSANASRSVVTINKLSATGRSDTALGFVIAKNQVATAFQAIDSTLRLEVVFLDGRKVITQDIWACDRLKDWALIKVDTGNTPALARMEGADLSNAGHYLIFNLASNVTRTISPVEIAGRHTLPAFGDRIQIQPPPSNEAVGGPLLTSAGLVAGILGGSITPGSRLIKETEIAATPIGVVPVLSGGKPARLEVLLDSGVLTPPLVVMQSLVSGGMARSISKGSDGVTTKDAAEFSRGDAVAWIYTFWQKKDKASKGEVSAQVYDARNISIVDLTPQTVSLPEAAPTLVDFKIALQKFKPGDYRVDVLWNEKPAFRTFFTIVAEPRP